MWPFGKPKQIDPFQEIVRERYERVLSRELNNPKRLEAVYSSRFWQQPDVERLRSFCTTACNVLQTPVSVVNIVADNKRKLIAAHGFEDGTTQSLDFTVCQHVVGIGTALPFGDLNQLQVCNLPAVQDHYGLQAYLGVPLIDRNGFVLGAFCVADKVPHTWSEADVSMLAFMASAIVEMHETPNEK